eukprot:CAMPEP_0206431012 /NCGR_PEP_ID=MMETSP0324_2-20121206/7133_1 /ASSEMBLY_ACC=CAM_ASM_000836 /TAXON_ID=2866 /ORGANISM="Crypthecodinium cohnii, Strain Seligo" /LENGTH=268 /DNA_ID=CAMNT_0053896903 /DNA_START=129 /DNA_END=935 /DNA_ORIENTATION=+
MIVCDLNSVKIWYGCLTTAWLFTVVMMVVRTTFPVPLFVEGVLWFCVNLTVAVTSRAWAVSRLSIYKRLRHFDVRECSCTFEADRAIVERNIAVLMRARENEPNLSDEEALCVFNLLVQTELPEVFAQGRHPLAFSYHHMATFAFIWSWSARVDMYLISGGSHVFWEVVGLIIWSFVCLPLAYGTLLFATKCFISLRGWRAWVRLVPLVVLNYLFAWGLQFGTFRAVKAVNEGSTLAGFAMTVAGLLGGMVVRVAFLRQAWDTRLAET